MLDGIQTKTQKRCYCAIGAGGEPCISREYCDKNGDKIFYTADVHRRRELVDALKKQARLEDEGRCRFNCRTQKEAFNAGFDAARAQRTNQLTGPYKEGAYREWKRRQKTTR